MHKDTKTFGLYLSIIYICTLKGDMWYTIPCIRGNLVKIWNNARYCRYNSIEKEYESHCL